MRTVLVPRSAAVDGQLEELPATVRYVAEKIIGALALQPELGRPAARGVLHQVGARVVRFDQTTRIPQLGDEVRGKRRRGDQDPDAGPRWRVIYRSRIHRAREIRFIEVLAVGVGHAPPGTSSAYDLAASQVRAQRKGGER